MNMTVGIKKEKTLNISCSNSKQLKIIIVNGNYQWEVAE